MRRVGRTAALRLLCLDPAAAHCRLFTYDAESLLRGADTAIMATSAPGWSVAVAGAEYRRRMARVTELPGWAHRKHDRRASLRVRGIEFAEIKAKADLRPNQRRPARRHHIGRIAHGRGVGPGAPWAPTASLLYRRYPEAAGIAGARGDRNARRERCSTIPVQASAGLRSRKRGVLDLRR